MNGSQIADRLARWMGLTKSSAAGAVDAVFETIGEALARNEDVRTAGFGTFMTMSRPAPMGRNPYGRRNLRWQGEARRVTSARAAARGQAPPATLPAPARACARRGRTRCP